MEYDVPEVFSRNKRILKWCGGALLVGLVMLVCYVFRAEIIVAMQSFDRFVKGLGWAGPLVFGAVFVATVPTMVPVIVHLIASGILFGVFWGFVVSTLSMFTGCMLTFAIGRNLCASSFIACVNENKYSRALNVAAEKKPWQVALLMRVCPVVPWNILNYILSFLPIPWYTYAWTTFIGIMPNTLLFAWLGHTAGSITAAVNGGGWGASWEHYVYFGVALFVFILTSVAMTFFGIRALKSIGIEEEDPDVVELSDDIEAASDGDFVVDTIDLISSGNHTLETLHDKDL